MNEILFSSESNEHYTPQWLLEMVVEAMGGIDLDPCANPGKTVPASRHFTREDNGLIMPWYGRVFMNPPYGSATRQWVEKLDRQWQLGKTREAITLTAARTDTQFFKMLHGGPVCYIEGRVQFLDADHQDQVGTPFPSALGYFGPNHLKFHEVFSRIGAVSVPYSWSHVRPK